MSKGLSKALPIRFGWTRHGTTGLLGWTHPPGFDSEGVRQPAMREKEEPSEKRQSGCLEESL